MMGVQLLKEKLEKKKAEFFKVKQELNNLQWRYDDEIDIPRKKKLINKFYKYRNSYSCPEKPSDYWWYYIHVTGLKSTLFTANTFQTDKDGKCSFKSEIITDGIIDKAIKITKTEYNKALEKFNKKLENFYD